MNRDEAREIIKRDLSCTAYLERSKNGLYCCPICGSGHGSNGSGAVKYYQDSNTWYCHACNQGGDIIDAYMLQTGEDHNAALSFLAARAGITIDARPTAAQDFTESPQSDFYGEKVKQDSQQQQAAKIENKGRTEVIPADYTAYYEQCRGRVTNPAALSYLEARGISIDTIIKYNIGFDPEADPAGAPGATGDSYKAHPTPRVIIPCTKDFYIARSIDPKTPPAFKAPNPKGSRTKLFNEAALYGGEKVIFVCEGWADALSFLEAGHAAISTNGKGNGKILIKQLQARPTDASFIICHDNDENPDTAAKTMQQAQELSDTLKSMGMQSIVYNVAGIYHDANDALKANRAAFEKNISDAINKLSEDDLTAFLDKIQTEAYKPYRTGLNFFDNMLGGGIIQQSLLLLMAAPGTGKTTLAQQLAESIAQNRNPVIYFNFEMSREQMLAKAISAKLYRRGGNKTATGILQGYKWTIDERLQIEDVINEYRHSNYPYIKYNPAGISSDLNDLLTHLTATGEAAKAKGEPAPAVIIDYLHLITSKDGLDVQELIKQAVTGLKQYAVEYNTFVIGIVATNRDSNKNGRQTMESARDSSNLEYTADYQISLNYYAFDRYATNKKDPQAVNPGDPEAVAELQQAERRAMILRVLKSRFSQPGKSAEVLFDAAHNIFYGTCDEFIPGTGFMLDNGAPAFDDIDNDIITTI